VTERIILRLQKRRSAKPKHLEEIRKDNDQPEHCHMIKQMVVVIRREIHMRYRLFALHRFESIFRVVLGILDSVRVSIIEDLVIARLIFGLYKSTPLVKPLIVLEERWSRES
jgi:hypothetical protein